MTFSGITNIAMMVLITANDLRMFMIWEFCLALGFWFWLSGFGIAGDGVLVLSFGCAICIIIPLLMASRMVLLMVGHEGTFLTEFMIPLILLREVGLVVWLDYGWWCFFN